MLTIGSIFRDSEAYVARYSEQVVRIREAFPGPVHVIAAEGDSIDNTYELLCKDPEIDTVLKVEHGGARFSSVVHPQRWRQLSVPGNAVLAAANRIGGIHLYVESDLLISAYTACALVSNLNDEIHAVVPMSMQKGRFYDCWGHVKDGRMFSPHRPFYSGWSPEDTELVPLESAGSCFVLSPDALRCAEFSAIDCIRGIGRSIAAYGYQLWLDPQLRVEHP